MRKHTYFCDRCGKEKTCTPGVDMELDGHTIDDIGWITLHCKTGYKKELDFCEECMKSFVGWMKNTD